MNIVLPIIFFAVIVGLFTPQRLQRYRWIVAIWIMIIIANYWMKN